MRLFENRLRADNVKLRHEVEVQHKRAEDFARIVETLQDKLKAADMLVRVQDERSLVLKDTIETLKEQNKHLLDTLRGPDVFHADPLALAKRNLALAEADDEKDDEQRPTLVDRLAQWEDPSYMPPLVQRVIAAARQAKIDEQAAAEELES